MSSFCAVLIHDKIFSQELLSCPVAAIMAQTLSQAGGSSLFYDGELDAGYREQLGVYLTERGLPRTGTVVLVVKPAPLITAETIRRMVDEAQAAKDGVAARYAGGEPALVAMPAERYSPGFGTIDIGGEEKPELPGDEGIIIKDAQSKLRAQQALMARINGRLLDEGVFIHEPDRMQISPFARIGRGSEVLPGCQIYGRTAIGADCVIGPNSMIRDAELGDGVRVNASQISESRIGSKTTVGPFAYVRPGCEIGEQVKIGDFVELKKAKVGKGTKMSHLTYLGDCELGEGINVGCGVVMVNYDGKSKHLSTIGDGAFIGCNVNLVSPVHVGAGAYVAAGSTITEDVPGDSLAVARARQVVKEGWATARKEKGKL